MSTQQDAPSRSDMIRCEYCGEDYSVTYRKCPFCDDMAGRPAPRPTTPRTGKGGKRQVGGARGGSFRPQLSIEPLRIIGFALGLILIVAAIYIVYSLLAPLFGGNAPTVPESSVSASVSASVSVSQPTPEVSASTPDVSISTPDTSVSTPDVSTPTSPTTPTTPTATVAAGTMVTINSDGVNIRETAGDGKPLDSSTKGAEVTVLETTTVGNHTWYKIRYNIGGGKTRDGYIRSDFVDVKSN